MSDIGLQSHIFGDNLHVAHDRRVENLRIAARHVDVGVAEHFGNIVDRGAAGQRQGCKRMSRAMESDRHCKEKRRGED